MSPAAPHEVDGRGRIGPVGDDVAGADDALGRHPEPRSLSEQPLGRLEVAVGPAEYDCGTVKAENRTGRRHAR